MKRCNLESEMSISEKACNYAKLKRWCKYMVFGRHEIFHYPVDKLPGWRWLPTRQGIYPGSSDWQSGQIGRS